MKKWLLIGIILLGFVLRVVDLANHPAGFTPDEASFGYDAYSILKTGRDQWGKTLPLVFKSFGDDKLPAYVYLTVPSVAIFGLTETAVRLPNAILGTLAIIVVYFLVKEMFKDEKVALLSGFLLAISPWHIMLSRGAFEANLTTFFLPLGILFFLKSFNNRKYLILSIAAFLVNVFTYHTARILTPLVIGFLIYIYRKELKDSKKLRLWIACFLGLFFISLFGYLTGGSRIASSGIFNDVNTNSQYLSVRSGEPVLLAKLFNNKFLIVIQTAFKNYMSYFSPQFLITTGPAEGTYGMVPGVGVIYLIESVFLISFFIKLVKKGITRETSFLLFWILISPIPAALTKGPGYAANRAAFMMPALQVVSAIGGIYLFQLLTKRISRKVILSGFGVIFAVSFMFFMNNYFVKQRALNAKDMVYGAKEVFTYLESQKDLGVMGISITRKISEPHIYAAFYTKMDPLEYQKATREWNFEEQGFQWVDQMGEYHLGKYTFSDNYNLPTWIVVVPPEEVPVQVCGSKILKKIYLPNGTELFYIRYNSISVSHEC